MAETQDSLMRNVDEFTELVAVQCLTTTTQSEAMDAQSVQMTKQAVKLVELQDASEDARTGEHRAR